jgi:translation initiation factor 4A
VLAQAPSGTGKTGGFLIGILSNMDPSIDEVQAGVLAPTRELADQIYTVAKGLVAHMGIRVHLAVGGGHVDADLAKLRRGSKEIPHLLIATPGRFYDLLNRKAINPRTFKALILDEADQLLDAKFKEQIYCILSDPFKWTEETQIGLFSATMIPAIAAVANTLLARNPLKILRDPEEVSLEGIAQYYLLVDRPEHKLEALCDLSDCLTFQQCTIFVNTQKEAENLCDAMIGRGFDVSCIHGDMEPKERKRVMDAFRLGKIRVLIATDLIGRGIDVQQISLVINFQLPVQHSNYIHRIGRSGRYGRKGASINIIDKREMRQQEEIEAFYGRKVAVLPMDLNIYN